MSGSEINDFKSNQSLFQVSKCVGIRLTLSVDQTARLPFYGVKWPFSFVHGRKKKCCHALDLIDLKSFISDPDMNFIHQCVHT